MSNLVLDLAFGFSLELVLSGDGILAARWLWCDLCISPAQVGVS